jgi:hypothetical protein
VNYLTFEKLFGAAEGEIPWTRHKLRSKLTPAAEDHAACFNRRLRSLSHNLLPVAHLGQPNGERMAASHRSPIFGSKMDGGYGARLYENSEIV